MSIQTGFRAILSSLRADEWGFQRVYCSFILGEITADEVYKLLRSAQKSEFLRLHSEVKSSVEKSDGRLPTEVVFQLGGLLLSNPRRLSCVLVQVDALIDRDVDRNIFKTTRRPTLGHET